MIGRSISRGSLGSGYAARTFQRSIKLRAKQTFGKSDIDVKALVENYDEMVKTIFAKHLHKGYLLKELKHIRDNYSIISDSGKELGYAKKDRDGLSGKLMELKSQGQGEGSPEYDTLKRELREIKKTMKTAQKGRDTKSVMVGTYAARMPVLIEDSVPLDGNEEIVHMINCTDVESVESAADKKAVSHKFIGQELGIIDLEVASRVCGHAFYYLIGDGALLEQALVQYAMAKARARGYIMCSPPSIMREEVVEACGFRPRDTGKENQIYKIEGSDFCLTATAEISLAALESKKVFRDESVFPKRYVGVSRAYRSEAGARGATTAGIYRVHEFTKVELFHFTTPERAMQELEDLKDFQVEMITELGLKAKVLNMPASDLGFSAAKKYDIEAWMPGRQTWGEVTSTSYCRDYQARRMNIKYVKSGSNHHHYVHTLNGTAMAVPRVIVAIIENFWDPVTQSVAIPEVLRPYMGGMERIYKQEH